jgi:hypothetical protein
MTINPVLSSVEYAKCGLYLKHDPVTGEKSYEYFCFAARGYSHLCGQHAKYYEAREEVAEPAKTEDKWSKLMFWRK